MRILFTGFDPFGGEKINPAGEAVKMMKNEIQGAEILKARSADGVWKGRRGS